MPEISSQDGRWIVNRGALCSPCDGGGCKRHIEPGERYWRVWGSYGLLFCVDCAPVPLEVMEAAKGPPPADRRHP